MLRRLAAPGEILVLGDVNVVSAPIVANVTAAPGTTLQNNASATSKYRIQLLNHIK